MSSCGWFPLSYDEIRDWVERHHDRLPKSVAELSAFPVPFRTVIVNYVSPQQRTLFWEEHPRTFLDPRSGLTPDQRKFVAVAVPFLRGIFGSPLAEGQATRDRWRGECATSSPESSALQSLAWSDRRNRPRDCRYQRALD
jgi:hypothetical protein